MSERPLSYNLKANYYNLHTKCRMSETQPCQQSYLAVVVLSGQKTKKKQGEYFTQKSIRNYQRKNAFY